MNKQSANIGPILKALLGAGIGGAIGYEGTPRLGGYEYVESARRSAALMHGITGAAIGGLGGQARSAWKVMDPISKLKLGAGGGAALLAEEALPMGLATMKRQQESAEQQGANTIPAALQRALSSSTSRGAGAGAALAGIAGIISGLRRRQTDEEFKNRTTRGAMVTGDTMKYVLPAMLAGGIIGSLRKSKTEV